MSQIERIYFLHNEIIKKKYPNTKTIMQKFGVSESSARRDIDYLREFLHAPVEFNRTKNGFFYSSADFHLPFENVPEVMALLGLLHKMAEEAGLAGLPEVTALKERLSAILSQDGKRLIDAVYFEKIEAEPVSGEKIRLIFDAMQQGVSISFRYHKPSGEESQRVVDPLKLINYQWRWYLLGFCHLRNAIRIFYLFRMTNTQLTSDKCRVCEISTEKLNTFLGKSFGIFKGNELKDVSILFRKDAATIVKEQIWHVEQEIQETPDGLVLRLPVADFTEIMMKVLQFGSRAQVLEPETLRLKMADEIKNMYDAIQHLEKK